MKVLILGADGYLGWPTTMYFSNKGCKVYAVDNLSKRKIETEFGTEPLNTLKPFGERVKTWNENQKNITFRIISILAAGPLICLFVIDSLIPLAVHFIPQL